MAPRKPGDLTHEAHRALLSLAGIRVISQAKVTGGAAGSDNIYTVLSAATRRVVVYIDHASNVVRFNIGATATANHIPIKNQTYFVVDAEKDQVLHFYDTTGGTLINIVEID